MAKGQEEGSGCWSPDWSHPKGGLVIPPGLKKCHSAILVTTWANREGKDADVPFRLGDKGREVANLTFSLEVWKMNTYLPPERL